MGIQSSNNKLENTQESCSNITSSSTPNIQIERLETFTIVWLDEKIRIDEQTQQLKKRLHQLTTNSIYFDDYKLCEQWLTSRPTNDNILFIVSPRHGGKIVQSIHNLTSIIGIYVFSPILESPPIWIQQYSKVRGNIFTPEELIQQILEGQRRFESLQGSKTIEIFKAPCRTHILHPEYASIIWYQLLLELLLSISYLPSSPSPQPFIDILRQSIPKDDESLNLINEFELTYEKQNPMKWLINNTPIDRFIHKALREQNIELLFYLRFFLVDIHDQLKSNQLSLIRAYRKQPMSSEMIKNLLKNVNNHLMMNDFLSTSIKPIDTSIVDKNESGYETVFIEIDAQKQDETLPFAYFPNSIDTGENDPSVVFMCGSIFKIISMEPNLNSSWILKLSLVGSKELNILNETQIKLRKTNDLLMVVEFLDKSNELDKANIYCHGLLRELPYNHLLIPSINEKLNINRKCGSISLEHSKFVFVGLTKDNLGRLAFEILNVLQSLLIGSTLIVKDVSEVNFDAICEEDIYIFTNSEICPSLKTKSKPGFLYVLEEENKTIVEKHHFNNSEDLMNHAADELYRCYMSEIKEDRKSGETTLLKEKEEIANEIPKKIKKLYETSIKTLVRPDTTVTWLDFNNEDNGISERTKRLFEGIVSSFLIFNDPEECFEYSCGEGSNHSVYLIIDDRYDDRSIATLLTLGNIKKIYRYNTLLSINFDQNVFSILISHLIDHYNTLANQYQNNLDFDQAKIMFEKAASLCGLFSRIIQ